MAEVTAMNGVPEKPLDRVVALLSLYSSPEACAAHLLCDRHDPVATAVTLVSPELSLTELTYGELRADSERLAAAFRSLGVRPGDRIATLMGKTRAYVVTLMAIWRLGAVHVPLFTAFAPPAILYRLTASSCRLIVCDAAQQPKLSMESTALQGPAWKVVTTGPADASTLSWHALLGSGQPPFPAAVMGGEAPIVQIYTSGTTGSPKGVVVPLRALASFQTYMEFALALTHDDILWNAADPGWAYGLYFGVIAPLAMGVRTILLEGGFSVEATYGVLSRCAVTHFAAAPTAYRSLRASPIPPPRNLKLRCAASAGEPLTPEINEWAIEALGVPVYDHYGQTETGMLINNHHHPALRRPLKPGSMGHPMPGWTAVILKQGVDEPASTAEMGRVAMDLAKSPLMWFDGYAADPATNVAKLSIDRRWYITGDTARADDAGYCYFASRDDDVIIMAGYRIGPFEIESVLTTHPAVRECAVVAMPDALRGEVLVAAVVVKEDFAPSNALTLELQNWVKQRYAAHAYPRQIRYLEILPKTPSGKIQRYVLRRVLRGEIGAA